MNKDELIEYAIRTSEEIKEEKKPELINYFYKQQTVIDRLNNEIDLVIELIKQQPTEDDTWILNRLNGFKIILEDKEVSE